ncbi:hypothetical protein [Hymenobacter sp. AT01-02]|nr:hypothetical protein [Hymenobacter sp. AT01-02]
MRTQGESEIADHLGISKRTVENQITTALPHLKISFKNDMGLLFLLGSQS